MSTYKEIFNNENEFEVSAGVSGFLLTILVLSISLSLTIHDDTRRSIISGEP